MFYVADLDAALAAGVERLPDAAGKRFTARKLARDVAREAQLLDDPLISAALAGQGDVDKLERLVDEFDEETGAYGTEKRGEEYKELFSRARAYSSAFQYARGGTDGGLAQVIYEAYYFGFSITTLRSYFPTE